MYRAFLFLAYFSSHSSEMRSTALSHLSNMALAACLVNLTLLEV
jgi:hypothetical protein